MTVSSNPNSRQLARTWPYPRQRAFIETLRLSAERWFKGHSFACHTKMPYCLDNFENWPRNIILPEVVKHIEMVRTSKSGEDSFPLHKYLHHGLSSQAMLFNLVGPLIVRNDYDVLREALTQSDVPWPGDNVELLLEHDDRRVFNEDAGQPTSIDLVVLGKNGGASVFIEAKLVEKEFGGCSVFAEGNCDGMNPANDFSLCYLHHIGRTYWTRMKESSLLTEKIRSHDICIFTNYYQFFREVLFAMSNGGHFVLLHDQRNPVFIRHSAKGGPTRGLWPLLTRLLPNDKLPYIHSTTIQEIVAAAESSRRHDDWIDQFKEKYGLQ